MPIIKELKKELKGQKINSPSIPIESGDDSYTSKDKAIMDLAKLLIWGILVLIGLLIILLFFLILSNNQNASTFKDIVSTFIAVASGLLGSILGYYYKNSDR
jgi:uncharacterized membrane protein